MSKKPEISNPPHPPQPGFKKEICFSAADEQYKQNIEKYQLKTKEEMTQKIKDLYFTNDINNFAVKFRNIVDQYVVPDKFDPFIYSTNEKFLFVTDINDDRIRKYHLFNHLFTTMNVTFPLPRDSFKKITLKKDNEDFNFILSFWLSITNKVANKELLNFPLCIYTNQDIFMRDRNNKLQKEEIDLYFFKHQQVLITGFNSNMKSSISDVVFQKLLIFMTLSENNLISGNYKFDEIKLPKAQVFTFKIKDMCFTISVSKIILLSPETVLVPVFNQKGIQHYIDSLDEVEKNFLKDGNKITFYEYFFFYFRESFNKIMFNTRNILSILKVSDVVDVYNIREGRVYIFKQDEDNQNIIYVCVLQINSTHARLLLMFDGSAKGTLSLMVKTFSINELKNKIYDPDFIFDKQLFTNVIGKIK